MYKREKNVLLVDTTFLFDQYAARGIGRVGKEVIARLIKEILEDDAWEVHLLGFQDLDRNLIELAFTPYAIEDIRDSIQFTSLGDPKMSGVRNIPFFYSKMRPVIKDINPTVYLATHFERGLPTTPYINAEIAHVPTIVFAHDAIPLVNDAYSIKSPIHNFLKKKFFNFMWQGVVQADLVLAPSNFSRNDLIEYGKVPSEKIERLYLGIDKKFYKEHAPYKEEDVEPTLTAFNVQDKSYIFYDSGLEQNKGVDALLEIFSEVSVDEESPDYLVVVGSALSKGEGYKIQAKNKEASLFLEKARELEILPKIIATDRISDEDLILLLHNADAYLYLSQYEGFGFGPIQAMAAGVPAIVANKSCLPEITREAALLVEPDTPSKSATEIKKFLKDEKTTKKFIKKGKSVAKSYNWTDYTQKLWDIIEKIANKYI